MQIAQLAQGVTDLQQRPMGIAAQAPEQLLRRGAQINHGSAATQGPPVCFAQHGAAAGGQHRIGASYEVGQDLLFDVAKTRLAFAFEEQANGATKSTLDFDIGIEKASVKVSCQVPANGGLATAGHPDQGNRHA